MRWSFVGAALLLLGLIRWLLMPARFQLDTEQFQHRRCFVCSGAWTTAQSGGTLPGPAS